MELSGEGSSPFLKEASLGEADSTQLVCPFAPSETQNGKEETAFDNEMAPSSPMHNSYMALLNWQDIFS